MQKASLLTSLFDTLKYKTRHNPALMQAIEQVERLHRLSPIALREAENDLFLNTFRVAFRKSPFYRNLYQQHGINETTIRSLDDIQKLPAIDKTLVRQNSHAIATVPKQLLVKGHTSGTTGSPLVVYRSWQAILRENAYLWYFRNSHGLSIREPVVCIRGQLGRSVLSYHNKAENILYLSSYNLNEQNQNYYARLIEQFAPKAIWGYPSSLEILATLFERSGIQQDIPLIFTSSETLYQFQIDKLSAVFGATVHDWYGNAERTIAIGQCSQGRYHMVPGYGFAEFGQNSVITTNFINTAFPLIRYEVSDLVKSASTPCSCGNPGQTIARIEGRMDDCILLPDGTKIGRLDVVFKGVDNIEYAQIIQQSTDEILLHVVKAPAYRTTDEAQLINNMQHRIGSGVTINLQHIQPEDIIRSKAGKYKLVINQILTPG